MIVGSGNGACIVPGSSSGCAVNLRDRGCLIMGVPSIGTYTGSTKFSLGSNTAVAIACATRLGRGTTIGNSTRGGGDMQLRCSGGPEPSNRC